METKQDKDIRIEEKIELCFNELISKEFEFLHEIKKLKISSRINKSIGTTYSEIKMLGELFTCDDIQRINSITRKHGLKYIILHDNKKVILKGNTNMIYKNMYYIKIEIFSI